MRGITVKIECLYQISPRCLHTFDVWVSRGNTCPACVEELTKQYGSDWMTLDWHRALMPEASKFRNSPAGLTDVGDHEVDIVVFDADMPASAVDPVGVPDRLPVKHLDVLKA